MVFTMDRKSPSLYEILSGNFTSGLPLEQVTEEDHVILSVLDNIQRILNARAGIVSHLPDYGLPDMTKIQLRYAIDAELGGVGLVRYGTEFMPEGKVMLRHLKQQQYLDARSAM